MPLKIAIEGIDGSGKTNVTRYIFLHRKTLCPEAAFTGFTSPDISSSALVRWFGTKTKKILDSGPKESKKIIEGIGYLIHLILYFIAGFQSRNCEVVISDRDVWVTHQVYAAAVFKFFEKFFDRYLERSAAYPQVIFYLKTDVQNSLTRTKTRGYFQNHENEACLEQINSKYDAVISRIKQQGLSDVIEIDTNNKDLEEVCKLVEKQIRYSLRH